MQQQQQLYYMQLYGAQYQMPSYGAQYPPQQYGYNQNHNAHVQGYGYQSYGMDQPEPRMTKTTSTPPVVDHYRPKKEQQTESKVDNKPQETTPKVQENKNANL